MILLVLIILLGLFVYLYSIKTKESKEEFSNFEIQNLNCSKLSQFPFIPNLGMKNETSMYDPYNEIKPELFEKFLNLFCISMKGTQFTRENVKNKLNSSFQKWFEIENKKVNYQSEKYKILLIGNFREMNKFYFGNYYCFDDETKLDGKILMYRPKAYFNYIVHWKFNDEEIKEAKVTGIVRQEDLINDPITTKYREFVPNSSKTFSNIPSKEETSLILKNRNEKKKMLNNIYFNEKQYDADKEQGFICYDQYNFTSKKRCESGINLILERKSRGVWDKPCENNSDCPFYKQNKNYHNSRGGCINGFCEMPVNANQLSPSRRERNDLNNLFCHNCDTENGDDQNKCCESQKNKTFPSYDLLASPDYAFLNDYIQREQNKEQLFERNLKLN